MPVAGGGFEQAYNAQIAVDVNSLLIVAAYVSQQCNDKHEIAPMVAALATLPATVARWMTCWPTTAITAPPMCRPVWRTA